MENREVGDRIWRVEFGRRVMGSGYFSHLTAHVRLASFCHLSLVTCHQPLRTNGFDISDESPIAFKDIYRLIK